MADISVIIPFLNEEEGIPFLVSSLNEYCTKSEKDIEVIFVDDGSTDASIAMLRKQKISGFKGKIVQLSKNYGSHMALRAGIREAVGSRIAFMYADLQDPIELIGKMDEIASKNERNIVWATRKSTQSGLIERTFSGLYARLMKKHVSDNFPAKGFDIVMFDNKVQAQLNENIEANSSIFLQILTMGFSQETIEYDKSERKTGKSKWTFSKRVKLFIDSFVAFSYFPIKLVSVAGIILFITGLLWSGYLIGRKLILDDLESGWPALMSVILIGLGVTNIGLGIVAEYLWRTLDASRKRPGFIVNNIISLEDE